MFTMCYVFEMDHSAVRKGVCRESTPPLDNCRKNESFFLTNRLFFARSLPKLLLCFFCSVQLFYAKCRLDGCIQYLLIKIESNLHCTRLIKLAVVPKRGSEWRGPTSRLYARTTQRWRAVGYSVLDLTGLGIEPQTFRIDSDIFHTALKPAGLLKSYENVRI